MFLKQFYLSCLAHASYIVIDERTKTAAVVDPQRDIEQYMVEAERLGAEIEHVLLTHFHADFISGHLELRDRVGARIYLGAKAKPEYDFVPLRNGEALEFGDVRLRILETPGHTPEGISIVVHDLAENDGRPQAVFTGDTLFVGDVGRPDLMASVGVTPDELAGWLYDSLHEKLMTLPDETLVYPAHGAGSMCGKNLSKETFSTIGAQRELNYALQPMTKDEFRGIVTAGLSEPPAYFKYDALMNTKERGTLDDNLARTLKPLTPTEVLTLADAGAQVVDVRHPDEFATGHLARSTNVGLGGKFATWSGTVLDPESSIVLIAEPGTEREAAMRLGRIGLDNLAGYLDGGLAALDGNAERIAPTPRVETKALAGRLADDANLLVLDIRSPAEWANGHIPDSLNIPLPKLLERLDEVPRDRELAVVCLSGYRSSIATSLLFQRGITNLSDVVGGMEAWTTAQLPTTAPQSPRV